MHYKPTFIIAMFVLLSLVSAIPAQQVSTANLTEQNSSVGRGARLGPVGGTGTTNYIAIWTSSTTLGNSVIYQSGGKIGIGTTTPGSSLDVAGNVNVGSTNAYRVGQNTVLSIAGLNNVFLGTGAGINNNTGYGNAFAGSGSGYNNATGSYNTFSGFQAGYFNSSGGSNTFSGAFAGLYNTSGQQNSFFGSKAGLSNTSGCCNTFTGNNTGYWNQTGFGNTFTGYTAGFSNASGEQNTFSGSYAGYSNTSGGYNTFTGFYAGFSNTSGGANTYAGFNAGASNNGTDNIYLGHSAGDGVTSENNTTRLGSAAYISSTYVAGIYGVNVSGATVQINSNGQLGTVSSSRRYKEQIRDMGDGSSQLMRLRPVTFLYKPEYSESPRKLQYGLIAEEVAEVYPELVEYGMDGQPYTVRYQLLIPMLVNEAEKQYRRAEAEAALLTMQEQKIEQLEQRLSRLEGFIGSQIKTADRITLDILGSRASQ